MQNCEIVLDRSALLAKVPKGGAAAEIGVNRGAFSEVILSVAEPEKLHLIDMWGSERYHQGLHAEVRRKFESEIAEGQVEIHNGKLSTEAVDEFADSYFDWVYLDTDHSYKVTKEELEAYAPKMKASGVIAGHDYVVGNWVKGSRYGVVEAVHEFCVAHDWELICVTAETMENRSFAIRRISG